VSGAHWCSQRTHHPAIQQGEDCDRRPRGQYSNCCCHGSARLHERASTARAGEQGKTHLLPPSSLILLPNSFWRPAYRPRWARLISARVTASTPSGIGGLSGRRCVRCGARPESERCFWEGGGGGGMPDNSLLVTSGRASPRRRRCRAKRADAQGVTDCLLELCQKQPTARKRQRVHQHAPRRMQLCFP